MCGEDFLRSGAGDFKLVNLWRQWRNVSGDGGVGGVSEVYVVERGNMRLLSGGESTLKAVLGAYDYVYVLFLGFDDFLCGLWLVGEDSCQRLFKFSFAIAQPILKLSSGGCTLAVPGVGAGAWVGVFCVRGPNRIHCEDQGK